MKTITINTKFKVIKLFLSGISFDEIAQQTGISKGSVVNIVNEFREGHLPLPPGMTEYVDQLRTLVVDMLKYNTTVPTLKNYVKLHAKLQEMGVGGEQFEQWLGICGDISTAEVSSNQFVQAALDLASAASGSGLSYADVVADYNAKLDASKHLDEDIGQKKEELSQMRAQAKEEKKQASDTLNSINQAITTAQETYQEQKKEIDAQLEQYMARNQLSWQKVKLVTSVLGSEFAKADLTPDDISVITEEISSAVSLAVHIKQQGKKKEEFENSINQLAAEEVQFKSSVDKLGSVNNKLLNSILENGQKKEMLTQQIEEQEDSLKQLESVISGHKDVIGVSHLMLELLLAPDSIPDSDVDQLTRLILYLWQYRQGINRDKVKIIDDELLYECKIPLWYFDPVDYGVDMKEVRYKLATCLAPCLKDEFMTKFEWIQEQRKAAMQEFLDFKIEIPKVN
jgi:DNA-binding transcriptional regulator GbsR (MarR family)